jgi:hypothetical protein
MMRAPIWTGMFAGIVSVATVGMMAQQPPTPQTQPPTPPTSQTPQTTPAPQTAPAPQSTSPSSTDKKITLTGCLKAAPQAAGDVNTASATGTAGSATSTATGTTGSSTEKFVLTGASAAPGDTASAAATYRLIANPAALGAHVGKKLELVGAIDPSSTADPKDPSASAPAFRVESGKIVAASCSE